MSKELIFILLLVSITTCYLLENIINYNGTPYFFNIVKAIDKKDSYFKLSELFNLSDNRNDSVYGQISLLNNSLVYFTWQDSNYNKGENGSNIPMEQNYDIFFKVINLNNSYNNGTLNLSNNLGFSEHPHVSSSKNNVFVTWIDTIDNDKYVLFRSSNDSGIKFDKPIILSNKKYNSSNVEITSHDNNVFLVWQQTNTNGSSIVFKVSDDYGKTFSQEKIISNLGANSYPKIAVNGDNVYVSWNVDQIDNPNYNPGMYFSASNDSGKSFSSPINLNIENSFNSGKSQISANNAHIYIMWTQKNSLNEYGQLYMAKSDTNGHDFNVKKISLSDYKIFNPANVDIYLYNNTLFASFEGDIAKNNTLMNANTPKTIYDRDIFFTMFNFSSPFANPEIVNLSNNAGTSECSSLIVNPETRTASISWEDYTLGNHEIFFRNVNY